VLTAREEACAAPRTGTYRAVLSIRPNEASAGCCTVRAGYDARVAPLALPGAKDDWSRGLPDMRPAIAACLSREGNRAQSVAGASPAGSRTIRVRMIEGNAAVGCPRDAGGAR